MQYWRRAAGPAFFAMAFLAPAVGAQQAASKFAYIDSRIIMQRAPGSAEAQAAFQKEREAMAGSAQRLSDSLKAAFDAYSKTSSTLTPAQREEREKGFRDKQVEFDQRVGQMEQQMQQRQFELLQPIMNQIRTVLDAIRAEEGYTFIFDVGAEGGVIVAADKNLDITERVIARLKPIPATVAPKDSNRASGAPRPAPAGVKPPTKPPTQ